LEQVDAESFARRANWNRLYCGKRLLSTLVPAENRAGPEQRRWPL